MSVSLVDADGVELMTEMEAKASIDSLDALHAKRRQILPEYALLRALHGPNGKWDARRKARLEAAKIGARIDLVKTGEKVTEALVDAMGHGDAGYVQFIEDGITGATRYVELDAEMTEIEEQLENRTAMLYAWGRELGLQR